VLNVDVHSKLHVLYGGTKVVQHTAPSKTGPGLKGINSLSSPLTSMTIWMDGAGMLPCNAETYMYSEPVCITLRL